jgi:hypothetical protein
MKDILVLTADKNAELMLKAFMDRLTESEKIRKFDFDIITHPKRDPGVANQSVDFVRPYIKDYRFLLVLFDHEGSGKERESKSELELQIEKALHNNGWQDRNVCILFEPELESWLWVNKAHLHRIMDWEHKNDIYQWIEAKGFLLKNSKPVRPKEAFESALKFQKIPRSASLYSALAQQADYRDCIDPSFQKFIHTIRNWIR